VLINPLLPFSCWTAVAVPDDGWPGSQRLKVVILSFDVKDTKKEPPPLPGAALMLPAYGL
jgi:hypothetical protein